MFEFLVFIDINLSAKKSETFIKFQIIYSKQLLRQLTIAHFSFCFIIYNMLLDKIIDLLSANFE